MPLVSVRADAKVFNYGAEVAFTQTYRNNGAAAIDATYVAVTSINSSHFSAMSSRSPSRARSQVLKLVSIHYTMLCQSVCLTITGIDGVSIVSHVRDRQSAPKERPEDPNNLPVIMYGHTTCADLTSDRYVTEQDRLYLQLKAVLPNVPAGKTVQFKITYEITGFFPIIVLMEISYVTEITMDEDRLRFSVPLKFTTTKRPPKPEAGYVYRSNPACGS